MEKKANKDTKNESPGERVIDRPVEDEIISVWKRELGQKHGLTGFLITTRIVTDEATYFIAR